MKKFSFSLETVHKYKAQLLDVLLNELAECMRNVDKQEKNIIAKESDLKIVNDEINEKTRIGINILEMTNYKMFIKRLQKDIEGEYKKLAELEKIRDDKKEEVLEMRKENMSLDLLKEKKIAEYQKEHAKHTELEIEEFVVNGLTAQKA